MNKHYGGWISSEIVGRLKGEPGRLDGEVSIQQEDISPGLNQPRAAFLSAQRMSNMVGRRIQW